jgi:hypothetical protein
MTIEKSNIPLAPFNRGFCRAPILGAVLAGGGEDRRPTN